jgi:hypothetical protein
VRSSRSGNVVGWFHSVCCNGVEIPLRDEEKNFRELEMDRTSSTASVCSCEVGFGGVVDLAYMINWAW